MNHVITIIKKEWAEVFRNKMVLFMMIFMPLFFTALPIVMLYFTGQGMGDMGELSTADVRRSFLKFAVKG